MMLKDIIWDEGFFNTLKERLIMTQKQFDIDTLLAQAGNRDNNDQYHSVSTPIYLTSNFRHRDLEDAETFDPHQQYSYSRLSTPTRSVLQKTLAELEGGANAFAGSSGMAAIQLVFSLFNSGDVSLLRLFGRTLWH